MMYFKKSCALDFKLDFKQLYGTGALTSILVMASFSCCTHPQLTNTLALPCTMQSCSQADQHPLLSMQNWLFMLKFGDQPVNRMF